MQRSWIFGLMVAAACAATPSVDAAGTLELRGHVVLKEGSKEARHRQGVLIYYRPDNPGARPEIEIPEEPFRIVTVRKEFTPRSLVVPVGSTVRFPNQDNILHNVFSLSGENRFDLGLYRRGDGKEVTFESPGVVRVYCNVHHSMVAYVVVVETPFYTIASADGSFSLSGLPAGPGKLTVWHERGKPQEIDVELPRLEPLEVQLEITKPKVPRHRNKFGKPYSRRRSGRDYG